MRIEINTQRSTSENIDDFQTNMVSFIGKIDDVINSFAVVKTKIMSVSGGIGGLNKAIDEVESRIAEEVEKKNDAVLVGQKTSEFYDLAIRIDKNVAVIVKNNNDKFYGLYSNLKPTTGDKMSYYWNLAFNWVCDGINSIFNSNPMLEYVADISKNTWKWTKETASKAWGCIKDFYEENKVLIKRIFTVAIVGLAIVGMFFIPASWGIVGIVLAGMCKGAVIGALIGGAVGGIVSATSGGSVLDGIFEGAFSGAIGGALMGGLGAGGQILGSFIKCGSLLANGIHVVNNISTTLTTLMTLFDVSALLDRIIDPENNFIADLNSKAHSSSLYNVAQIGTSAISVFTSGMTQTMQCFVAGTLVYTMYGLRKIEDLKTGDFVLSTNVCTNESCFKKIEQCFKKKTCNLIHVITENDEIISTSTHPYYVVDKGFIEARYLEKGFVLKNSNNENVTIKEVIVENLAEEVDVYNFSVEDFHTYYVGNDAILVHNVCRVYQNEDGSYDIEMEYKDDWTLEQRAEADLKAQRFSEAGVIRKVPVIRTGKGGRDFVKEFGVAPKGYDLDHIIDLQVGGLDVKNNIWFLNRSVNRSFGAQLKIALKDIKIGGKINSVRFV